MAINFAAVHEEKRWRKHRIHKTLAAAIDGKDGAQNLLRQIGRVAGMWKKYGNVHCVFVWEDDSDVGRAFRLAVEGSSTVESAVVPIENLLRFDANKCCTDQEIVDCFAQLPASTVEVAEATPLTTNMPLDDGSLFPNELPEGANYTEGLAQEVLVNRYERSLESRKACLDHYRCVCQVCNLDFSERYGPLGTGFIHVHHRVPIASIGTEYSVDPISDLVPVCPNCHAMLHRHEPPLKIEELRALLNDA